MLGLLLQLLLLLLPWEAAAERVIPRLLLTSVGCRFRGGRLRK